MRLDVPVIEAARRHRRLHRYFPTGVCFDCGEADEPARRALHRAVRPGGVDLADLASPPGAGVPCAHPHCHVLTSGDLTVGLDANVLPGCIAEAMSERVQRLALAPIVGAIADE